MFTSFQLVTSRREGGAGGGGGEDRKELKRERNREGKKERQMEKNVRLLTLKTSMLTRNTLHSFPFLVNKLCM